MSQTMTIRTAGTETTSNSYKVLRRDGTVVDFDSTKISVAVTKAFIAAEGEACALSSRVRDLSTKLTANVIDTLKRRLPDGGILHIEHIQDQVELALMRTGEHEVARRYVLYREARAKERAESSSHNLQTTFARSIVVVCDGVEKQLDFVALRGIINDACADLGTAVSPETIFDGTIANLYDGVAEVEVIKSAIFSSRALIESDPAYGYVTARLLLHKCAWKCWARRLPKRR